MLILAAYFLGQLHTLLKVEIYLLLLWLCSEAEPGCHSIVLKLIILNLFLIEFEGFLEFVHEHLVIPEGHRLRLIGIMNVHQVYSLESQVLPRLLKLVL